MMARKSSTFQTDREDLPRSQSALLSILNLSTINSRRTEATVQSTKFKDPALLNEFTYKFA